MVHQRWKSLLQIPLIMLLLYLNFLNASYALSTSDDEHSDVHAYSRELAGLAEKWNLTSNGVDNEGMNFRLNYIVSDFIVDSMIDAVAYTSECKGEGSVLPEANVDFSITTDDAQPGVGDFERGIFVDVQINPAELENSLMYEVTQDENRERRFNVQLCMRFSLYTNGNTPIEVNFLETVIRITGNLNSGFSIEEFNVEPKKVLEIIATEDYHVYAYKCDDNNMELSATSLEKAMVQGEMIRVCVTPDEEARENGVYMKAIESFTYYRDYGGPVGVVQQIAIENSRAASNFLTILSCTPGALVCVFETMLFASMFMSPGFVDGSGTALLQFGNKSGGRQRRNLESKFLHRSLQEGNDGVASASQFDLDLELVLGKKFNGILKTSSSSKINVITSFVAMGTVVALNLLSL